MCAVIDDGKSGQGGKEKLFLLAIMLSGDKGPASVDLLLAVAAEVKGSRTLAAPGMASEGRCEEVDAASFESMWWKKLLRGYWGFLEPFQL